MRLIACVLATLVSSGLAIAQSWQEYRYPDQFFTVAFPGDPHVETTTYQVADGRSVDAHVYSVHQDNAVFEVTVAELGDTGLEEGALIEHAIKMLSQGGEVKVNIPHRVNRVYGRQLSIARPDGTRSTVAVFDYKGRLYQIEGRSLSAENDATAATIRFAQSLVFTGGGSNRTPEEIQAARAACRGTAAGETAGVPGAAAPEVAPCRQRRRPREGG